MCGRLGRHRRGRRLRCGSGSFGRYRRGCRRWFRRECWRLCGFRDRRECGRKRGHGPDRGASLHADRGNGRRQHPQFVSEIVGWNGEVDAGDHLTVSRLSHTGGVDPHHAPEHIQQRTAAVAGIQRSIGLQESQVRPPGRKNPSGDRRLLAQLIAQREAYGYDTFTLAYDVGVSQGKGREGPAGRDLDVGQVRPLVEANDSAPVQLAGGQPELDLFTPLNHMPVGHYQPAGVHHEPGPSSCAGPNLRNAWQSVLRDVGNRDRDPRRAGGMEVPHGR